MLETRSRRGARLPLELRDATASCAAIFRETLSLREDESSDVAEVDVMDASLEVVAVELERRRFSMMVDMLSRERESVKGMQERVRGPALNAGKTRNGERRKLGSIHRGGGGALYEDCAWTMGCGWQLGVVGGKVWTGCRAMDRWSVTRTQDIVLK